MANGLPSKQKLWVRVPLPVLNKKIFIMTTKYLKSNLSPIRTASRTASRLVSFFFRHGSKESMESQRRQVILRRARQSKNLSKSLTKTNVLFESFSQVSTPFIALKIRRRRRGKRVLVKLAPLGRNQGERKSRFALSTMLRVEGGVSKAFNFRIEQELEMLFQCINNSKNLSRAVSTSIKQKQTKTNQVSNTSTVSPLQDKRDEVHRLAYKSRPFR